MNSHAAVPTKRSGGRITFSVLLVLLGVLLCGSLLLNCSAVHLLSGHAAKKASRSSRGEDESPKFSETHSYGAGDVKVVRICFSGIIVRAEETGIFATPDPVEAVIRKIRAARQDEDVMGILLEVNSPGGGVTDSDEIYHELMEFKQSEGVNGPRKIVVLVGDMAASGGYYISLPADLIVMQPTSIVGSIGVLLQSINFKTLSEKIGVKDVTIKSGENKDLLNPFQEVRPEQVAILQAVVDASYARFLKLVSNARGIPEKKLRTLADGRIFSAEDAVKNKLADRVGYRADALAALAGLLGEEDLFVVTYQVDDSFFSLLFGEAEASLSGLRRWSEAVSPRPQRLYLWRP